MILAAGFGTRMAPLTTERPKALVPLCGQPLLAHLLSSLERRGFDEIAVNSHHFADQIHSLIEAYRQKTRVKLFDSFEAEILDTGGGIRRMLRFFPGDEPILVHNVDILTDCDLAALMQFHRAHHCAATLVIIRRKTARPLRFDDQLNFLGRASTDDPEDQQFGFCGIQVIRPSLFRDAPSKFYSMDLYLQAARSERIRGYLLQGAYWRDIGSPADLAAAEDDVKNGLIRLQ